jgi:aminotransferase
MIPVFSNTLGEDEIEAVRRILTTHWLGIGPECKKFEDELSIHFRVPRLLLTNCATSAIYLALRVLDMPRGAEVIIPAIHFVAVANAVIELGVTPVFADVDPRTLNVTADEILRMRTRKTWGVFLLHYGGHPCDMDPVMKACQGLVVLEDAANAVASTYDGQAVGTFGDAGVWSFDSMKILVMGDGGALWLRDDKAHRRAWHLRNMGLSSFSGTDSAAKGNERWWEFKVTEPSGRFDSNDLLAAIGRVQLRRLPEFVGRRREVWQTYQKELAGVGDLVLPPEPLPGATTSYYLYWVQTSRRDGLARHLVDNGVYATFRYYPLPLALGRDDCPPMAYRASLTTLCLPLHQNLMGEDVERIVWLIRGFYRA